MLLQTLKPGYGLGYCPRYLLCVPAKIFERLIYVVLNQ